MELFHPTYIYILYIYNYITGFWGPPCSNPACLDPGVHTPGSAQSHQGDFKPLLFRDIEPYNGPYKMRWILLGGGEVEVEVGFFLLRIFFGRIFWVPGLE